MTITRQRWRLPHVLAVGALVLSGGLISSPAASADSIEPPEVQVAELDLDGVDSAALGELPDVAPLPEESALEREASAPDAEAEWLRSVPEEPAGNPLAPEPEPTEGAAPAPTASANPQDRTVPSPMSEPTPSAEGDEPGVAPTPDRSTPAEGDAAAALTEATTPPDVLTPEMDVDPFSVLGVTWDAASGDEVVVRYRVRQAGTWSEWTAVGASDVAPDQSGPDAEGQGARRATDPIVAVDADGVQLWASSQTAAVTGLKAVLVDPGEDNRSVTASNAAIGAPPIISRAQWGADESMVGCRPDMGTVVSAAVHHTASSNSYTAAEVPGILRGFLAYHTRPEGAGGRGWCDIGYNFLVDKFGRIFEGRSGGVDKPIAGVHTGGFNSRTVGVATIGDYGTAAPPLVMTEAVSQLITWKFAIHRINPTGTVVMISGGGASKYPAGTAVTFPTIFGHRDAQLTSCPGELLYAGLGDIRARAAQLLGDTVARSPGGNVESVRGVGGAVAVGGWVSDPDSAAPTAVNVVVGSAVTRVPATIARADVGTRGFSAQIPAPAGPQEVCIYGVNVGPGQDALMGCWRVTVASANPIGNLELVRVSGTQVEVSGWARDPDSSGPVSVHVYVGSTSVAWQADKRRADVGAHGFSGAVAAPAGTSNVCVYAMNIGPGANALLGCRTVTVDVPNARPPYGNLESVSAADGSVTVSGWAVDPDTTAPIAVHVYVDGTATATTAGLARPDVGAHGYVSTVPAAVGARQVCAYALNNGPGPHALLGCRIVTVPGPSQRPPDGNLENVIASAGQVRVVGWAVDHDDARAPVPVHVYVDGVGTAVTADRIRADVGQHGLDASLAAAPGLRNVCVYAMNTGPGANVLLGCRAVRVG